MSAVRLVTTRELPLGCIKATRYTTYPPRYKSLLNYAYDPNITEDYHNDSTDTSRNDIEDYVKNMKVTTNEDNYDKYKDDNSQDINSNEIFINTT